MSWPNNADGDVFRSLESNGFDFSKEYEIDINLDFDHWPLSSEELDEVRLLYPNIEVVEPEDDEDIGDGKGIGFLQFQVLSKLNYQFVTELQEKITKQIAKYGGWCNSWGVGQW